MNTLEYLLEKNKKYILSSKYQNTIYNGKTLCEYFGVESNTKKEGANLEYLLMELIHGLPYLDIKKLSNNIELYKKHQNLYFVLDSRLIKIGSLINQIDKFKNTNKGHIPLYKKSIMWCANKVKLYYINLETNELQYEVVDRYKNDIKFIDFLPINRWKSILENIDYNEYKELGDII